MTETCMIRVALPAHLRALARLDGEITVRVAEPATIASVLDAVESRYPMLKGTIRRHEDGRRRPFIRFFACNVDWSNQDMRIPLPDAVQNAAEPLLIVGAMAGG